jgi:hypothetical protein
MTSLQGIEGLGMAGTGETLEGVHGHPIPYGHEDTYAYHDLFFLS